MERRWGEYKAILYVLACLGLLLSIYQLYRAGVGLERVRVTVGQTPVEVFTPRGAQDARPAVVIAHGFSVCKQYMYPFAYTFARNGYVAAILDFSGHGKSSQLFPSNWNDIHGEQSPLTQDLEAAIRYARGLPGVDAERVALLGYSMGSAIVLRYARDHQNIQATIAVSSVFSDVLPSQPRNLLLLTGAWEFGSMKERARAALAASGGGEEGNMSGDFGMGSARKLVFVPYAEHVTIPFSRVALSEALNWLNAAFGRSEANYLDRRILWIGLFCLCALILFLPFSRLMLQGRFDREETPALEIVGVLLASGLPAIVTPLLLRVLPWRLVPLAVGDYLAGFFFLQGLMMIGLLLAMGALNGGGIARLLEGKVIWAAMLMFIYFAATFGVIMEYTLLTFLPISRRMPIIGALFLLLVPYCVASEYISRTDLPGLARFYPFLVKAFLLLSLGGGVFLGAPFILVLALPALFLLLVLGELFSRRIYALTGHPGVSGLFTAMVFAWLIGAVFPIT